MEPSTVRHCIRADPRNVPIIADDLAGEREASRKEDPHGERTHRPIPTCKLTSGGGAGCPQIHQWGAICRSEIFGPTQSQS